MKKNSYSYNDLINCIDNSGNVQVPTDPGLGIEYDWDYIKKNKLYTVEIS